MDKFLSYLDILNDIIWTWVGIPMLVLAALYFTVGTRFVQFRMLREMVRSMLANPDAAKETHRNDAGSSSVQERKPIGSFEAFAVSLSSRVGTGNLAGVASAIFVGGPGAVFWMWVMALLGSATAFVEGTLAQLYKRRGESGYYGGPAYYMMYGLGRRWMSVLFAFLIILTFAMANQTAQSNTLCDALSDAFGLERGWLALGITVATFIIIYGGIQRIAHFASIIVPFMAIGYLIIALVVIGMNMELLPHVFATIIEGAFGIHQVAGGVVGAAIMNGVKRGLFSNEAGEGSAPNAAAIADTPHPVRQGLVQALGVFTDTLVICTCTAFIILISDKYADGNLDGILLTKASLEAELGAAGGWFVTCAIFLFAYSTIIANYFYGENNVRFLASGNKLVMNLYRVLGCGMILLGGFVTLQQAWSLVDICMCLMTICNLAAIIQLAPKTFSLLRHFEKKLKSGSPAVFRREDMENTEGIECWE